jgi:hypothetical protein
VFVAFRYTKLVVNSDLYLVYIQHLNTIAGNSVRFRHVPGLNLGRKTAVLTEVVHLIRQTQQKNYGTVSSNTTASFHILSDSSSI